MGYHDTEEERERTHKTWRISIISVLLLSIGFFLFLYKTEACKSSPENCKEEFVEISASRASNDHKCAEGAVVEIVTSSHSGKSGIMCHCTKNIKPDAGQ